MAQTIINGEGALSVRNKFNAMAGEVNANATAIAGKADANHTHNLTAIVGATVGSVLFANATSLAQDNANFFWDNTNSRLGIKTNAPAFPLDVRGAVAVNGAALYVRSNPAVAWDFLKFSCDGTSSRIDYKQTDLRFGSNNVTDATETFTDRVVFKEDGSVGIGLTTVPEKFMVAGSINATSQSVNFSAGGARVFMDFITASKIARIGTVTGGDTLTGTQGELSLFVKGSEAIRINSTLDVGIGVTTILTGIKLQVAGTVYVNNEGSGFIVDAAGSKRVGFMKYSGIEGSFVHGNTVSLRFGQVNQADVTGGTFTEQMRIDNSGNISIGATTISEKLTIEGNIRLSGGNRNISGGTDSRLNFYTNTTSTNSRTWIEMWGTDVSRSGEMTFGATYFSWYTNSTDASVGTELMRFTSAGKLGIGLTSPKGRLHVSDGTSTALTTVNADNAFVLTHNTNNRIYFENTANTTGSRVWIIANDNGTFRYSSASDDGTTFTQQHALTIAHATGFIGVGVAASQLLHLQKAGADNYLKIDAGGTMANFSGIMLSEHNINWGWSIRHNASSDDFSIDVQDNTPSFTNVMRFSRVGLSIGMATSAPSTTITGGIASPAWRETQVKQNASATATSTSGAVITSGTFSSGGGKLIIIASGSGYKLSTGLSQIDIQIENAPGGGVYTTIGSKSFFFNVANQHHALGEMVIVTSSFGAGTNRGIRITNAGTVVTDTNDRYDITVLEVPH